MTQVKEIDLQQMPPLREMSQKMSSYLQERLISHLSALAPLLAPERILGGHVEGGSKERGRGADESYALLESRFSEIFREAFGLPGHLRSPLPAIKPRLRIYPWEYHYQLGADPSQTIIVSSPIRWVIAYDYPYTLHDLLRARMAGEKPQATESKQLAINSLAFWLALDRNEGVKGILEDLRFPVTVETSPVSGELPFMVANAGLESVRPQDDVIKMVTQLSGKPVFEELIDQDVVRQMRDPLAEKLMKVGGIR